MARKRDLKVHILIDVVQPLVRFVKITDAKVHDKNYLRRLELIPHSMIALDKVTTTTINSPCGQSGKYFL